MIWAILGVGCAFALGVFLGAMLFRLIFAALRGQRMLDAAERGDGVDTWQGSPDTSVYCPGCADGRKALLQPDETVLVRGEWIACRRRTSLVHVPPGLQKVAK